MKTATLKADAGSTSEVTALVKSAAEALGGLDVVIANAGWTRFSDFADLNAMSDDEWDRCWKTNVLGVKALAAAAVPIFNSNDEGGVVLVTSSIAGRSIGGSSMAYSVTKAAQLHLVKCVAKTQGRKVRCNAVLPGLLLTEWGLEYGEEKIGALKQAAALGKEVSLSSVSLSGFQARVRSRRRLLTSARYPADGSPGLREHVCLAGAEHEHYGATHPSRLWSRDPAPLEKEDFQRWRPTACCRLMFVSKVPFRRP